MTRKYSIELIEEHDAVNFYSIQLADEELSELERFFEKFPEGCEYDKDIDVIISWLDKIGERGALERYFRPEGRYGDGVGVVPIDVGNKLRLYCLRMSDKILIFGNGGKRFQHMAGQRNTRPLCGNADSHKQIHFFTNKRRQNCDGGQRTNWQLKFLSR